MGQQGTPQMLNTQEQKAEGRTGIYRGYRKAILGNELMPSSAPKLLLHHLQA